MIGPIVKNIIKKPSALDDLNVPQMIRAADHQPQSILYFFLRILLNYRDTTS